MWLSSPQSSNVVETSNNHQGRVIVLLAFIVLFTTCLIIFFIMCLLDYQTRLYVCDHCLFFKILASKYSQRNMPNVTAYVMIHDYTKLGKIYFVIMVKRQ